MKQITHFSVFSIIAVCLTAFMSSCGDDDDKELIEGRIPLKTINATSCIDLSDRSDWIFSVMYSQYNSTINGSAIIAEVNEKPYYFDKSYALGSSVPLGNGPVIRLVSPEYNTKETKAIGPPPPNIADQTTLKKLMAADVLSTYYSGEVLENIDISLTHANALLDFEFKDLPVNAEVAVQSLVNISPYKDGNNYKAIVLAEGGEYSASISVKIGNENLSVAVPVSNPTKSSPLPSGNYILRDTRYKFTVKYDADKKALSIDDLHRTKWSETYPITLLFSDKKIAEFKIYVGSPEGAREVSTNNLNPAMFWKDRLSYYPSAITYDNSQTISLTPHDTESDTFNYKFIKDSLFRHNSNIDKYIWAGVGDQHKLDYHKGYFRANFFDTEFNFYRFYIAQGNEWATEKGFIRDAYSLDDLKQETDTIMWCNIQYTYTSNIWDY